jgi:hypothetical protein
MSGAAGVGGGGAGGASGAGAGAAGNGGGGGGDPRTPLTCDRVPPDTAQCAYKCAVSTPLAPGSECPGSYPIGGTFLPSRGKWSTGSSALVSQGTKTKPGLGPCGSGRPGRLFATITASSFRATVTTPWLLVPYKDGQVQCEASSYCLLGTTGGFVAYLPAEIPDAELTAGLVVIDDGVTCDGVVP